MSEKDLSEKRKEELTEKDKLKKEKLEKESYELYSKVTDSNLKTDKEKVGWVLNHFPKTRDSDITCMIKFWETFHPDIVNEADSVTFIDLYKLTKLTTISRIRAKIQNEYNLFLASKNVRKHRMKLEDEKKEWAIEEQPDHPTYTVYIDESGKTDKYIIVGSLWILDSIESWEVTTALTELKDKNKISEFHFKEIKKNNLHIYKEVLKIVKSKASYLSFKAISVERSGNKNIVDTLSKLISYLLIDGIDHENKTERAPLPRSLQVIKDEEEKGADSIMLREIKIKLEIAKKTKFKENLFIDSLKAVNSKSHKFLQVTDLFTSSVNRILNSNSDGTKPKDLFAKDFLNTFGIVIENDVLTSIGDLSQKFEA